MKKSEKDLKNGKINPDDKPSVTESIVCNRSSITFSKEELLLLNKGLNFALPPEHNPAIDLIVNIESSLKYNSTYPQKQYIRCLTEKVIDKNLKEQKTPPKTTKMYEFIDDLKKRDCV